MRTFPGLLVAALVGAGIAFAADEAVPPVQTPTPPADASVPGKVELEIVDCGGVPHYAFAGEAEDYFPGEGLETEAELYEEAVLDAKTRFYGILSGGGPRRQNPRLRHPLRRRPFAPRRALGAFRRPPLGGRPDAPRRLHGSGLRRAHDRRRSGGDSASAGRRPSRTRSLGNGQPGHYVST